MKTANRKQRNIFPYQQLMNFIWILLASITMSGVLRAECTDDAEAAIIFMNAYKSHIDDLHNRKSKEPIDRWLQRSANITDSFKKTYKKLIDAANKEDPELGFDPIYDAQDRPDEGFVIVSCEEESMQYHYVTLKGMDWEEFRVVVKVVSTEHGWLVDGAGVINIPTNKRALRD